MSSFFRDLKQRKVYRVAHGYGAVACPVIRINALGFPVALVLNSKAHA